MKKFLIILAVSLSVSACTDAQNKEQATAPSVVKRVVAENINAADFSAKINATTKKQVLDVRTPQEWVSGIIKGANKINVFDADFKTQVAKLNKDVPVMVYCRSGGRSGRAMKILTGMGFKEVYNLNGGIGAWKAAQYEVVK